MKSSRSKFALVVAAISLSMVVDGLTAGWEALPPLPTPNGGFVTGTVGGKILVAGGTTWQNDVKLWLAEMWLFDPAERKWSKAGRLPFAVAYAVCAQSAEALNFVGGSSGTETHRQLYRLGADLRAHLVANVEAATVLAAGGVIGNELYVVGGTLAQERLEQATNQCFSVDLQTGLSRRWPDLPVSSFLTGTAVSCGGSLYVFGGASWNAAAATVDNLATAFRFSPSEGHWSTLPPYPFAARGLTAVALDDRRIYVGGGYKNDVEEFTSQAFIFDTKENTLKPSTPFPIRAMVHLVVGGEYLYCLGGEDRKRHRSDAAFRIRLADLRSEK